MIGLVVIGHAPFGAALFSCARHVYGGDPERCVVVDVTADAEPSSELVRASQAVAAVDQGEGVLVLVDMFGATPGNIAAQLSQAGRVEVVAGVNVPMLMRVLCYRNTTTIADLPEKALGGGASGIMKIASTAVQHQRPLTGRPPPRDASSNGPCADPDALPDGAPNDGRARLQDQQ